MYNLSLTYDRFDMSFNWHARTVVYSLSGVNINRITIKIHVSKYSRYGNEGLPHCHRGQWNRHCNQWLEYNTYIFFKQNFQRQWANRSRWAPVSNHARCALYPPVYPLRPNYIAVASPPQQYVRSRVIYGQARLADTVQATSVLSDSCHLVNFHMWIFATLQMVPYTNL